MGDVEDHLCLSPFQSRSARPNFAANPGSTRPELLQIIAMDESFIDHDCRESGYFTWPGTTCCAAASAAPAAAHAAARSASCGGDIVERKEA